MYTCLVEDSFALKIEFTMGKAIVNITMVFMFFYDVSMVGLYIKKGVLIVTFKINISSNIKILFHLMEAMLDEVGNIVDALVVFASFDDIHEWRIASMAGGMKNVWTPLYGHVLLTIVKWVLIIFCNNVWRVFYHTLGATLG